MKTKLPDSIGARVGIYIAYGLLILPLGVILAINKLISPLSPTISFIDLEYFQMH